MFTFLFTKKGKNFLKFATQPYGISLSLFKVAAKLPDEGILYFKKFFRLRLGFRRLEAFLHKDFRWRFS